MGMGIGAGFGMMLPGMIQNAMAKRAQVNPNQFQGPAAGGQVSGPAAACRGGGAWVTDLSRLTPLRPAAAPPIPSNSSAPSPNPPAGNASKPAKPGKSSFPSAPAQANGRRPLRPKRSERPPARRLLFRLRSQLRRKTRCSFLKFNAQMVMGAFGVQDTPSGDVVVVCASQLAGTTTPLDVSRTITASPGRRIRSRRS